MPKFRVKTTGGRRLSRYVKAKQKQAAKLKGRTLTVGFHDRRIAALAATHEFGLRDRDGNQALPERPAFRNGLREARADWKRATVKAGKALSDPRRTGDEPDKALREGAVAVSDTIKQSYSRFHGEPLSERQRARKRGTAGEGRQLVGHRGERLISHIEARDSDGSKVDV